MCYGLDLRTTYRNRYCRGRSDCRSLPGGDSGHSCRDGQCSPSAAITDENWINGKKGYILIRLVHCTALGCGIGGLARSRPGTAPVSTVLSLYPILFLVSLPVADLLMINGHPQQSCPILGVRQICAGFGSRLQTSLSETMALVNLSYLMRSTGFYTIRYLVPIVVNLSELIFSKTS